MPVSARDLGHPEPDRGGGSERQGGRTRAERHARGRRVLLARGARAVLVKGGHGEGPTSDDLLLDGISCHVFSAPRLSTRNTHGTGCTLSSAIAAYLAHGYDLASAIAAAKAYVSGALEAASALQVGHGPGPLHHFHALWAADDPGQKPARSRKRRDRQATRGRRAVSSGSVRSFSKSIDLGEAVGTLAKSPRRADA